MGTRVLLFTLLLASVSTPTFLAQQSNTAGFQVTYASRVDGAVITALASDRTGSIWAAGVTRSPAMPTTADALQPAFGGMQDIFLERVRPDGTVAYLTYVGGRSTDSPAAIAVDAQGYIYLTGVTYSGNYPVTPSAYDGSCGIDGLCQGADQSLHPDGFVTKLSPDGRTIVYSTFVGGGMDDYAMAIAVDGAGRAHISGWTASPDYPVTAGALRTTWQSAEATYTRLSADGSTLEYSTLIGGSSGESARAIAVDADGNAYVTGQTNSPDFSTLRPYQAAARTNAGTGFIAKFTDAGPAFSTYFGGSKSDAGLAVAVTASALYVAGGACSDDFPGAAQPATMLNCEQRAFISMFPPDGSSLQRTVILNGSDTDRIEAMLAGGDDVLYLAGTTFSPDFPVTADAAYAYRGGGDNFVAVLPMTGTSAGAMTYGSFIGGSGSECAARVARDLAGGLMYGSCGPADYPTVNGSTPSARSEGSATFAYFAPPSPPPSPAGDIVLYARDGLPRGGRGQLVADCGAAGGTRIWNPDAGVPKLSTAAASPANYFEMPFDAQAGVAYHLWLRMKADNDAWQNDSVFVQFSGSVDGNGNPVWRSGTTSAATVSLEDCSGCGERGWGWNDNGYNTTGTLVRFATTGRHTIRVQQREDGVSIDQIVLSSATYATAAPGTAKDDTRILPQSTPPPPPPPPSDPKEIVMYVARDLLPGSDHWQPIADASAADGAALWNEDRSMPKAASAVAAYPDYFEVSFSAEAGIPYHLWLRSRAQNDDWLNDSVFVQFSNSTDAGGTPIFRIGSGSQTNVILEDCGGCGEQGWGWQDNAYDAFAAPIYFDKTGPQTIRVIRREDGMLIDQIVLSAAKYLNTRPGQLKNDSTIVPK